MIDWYNETAKRVHGMPNGWKWCSLDAHNKPEGNFEVRGAVPVGVISRGPRKGWDKFPPAASLTRLWMRFADVEETKRLWEQETGLCSKCEGSSQETAGWSERDGHKTRPCSACEATGQAQPQGATP